MMGHTHALTGAVAWLAAVPLLSDAAVLHEYAVTLSPGQIAAGTIVCAGAGMLPDVDHHSGTIANTFGIVTKLLCRGVEAVTGGHRHATHSFLFTAAARFGAWSVSGHYQIRGWVRLFFLIRLA